MRITDVMIDRYGVWNDLLLPVQENGLTVIYGPNEAGKSTLMRFIRGVLYGFPASGLASDGRQDSMNGWGGSLRLKDRNAPLEASRHIDEQGRQHFRGASGNRTLSESDFEKMLQEVDADIYKTIYTLGLKELRELATLQTDQVGEYIYGTSLGLIGHRLMQAEQKTRGNAQKIADFNYGTGRLFDLSGEYSSMQDALRKSGQVMQRYQQSLDQSRKLESVQAERRHRLNELRRERSNYQFLQRVWGPWKRQRELSAELRGLPDASLFPNDGLTRLDRLEQEKRAAEKNVKQLRREQSDLRKALDREREHYDLRDHASAVRALIDMRGLVESAERHLANVSADASMLKAELDEKLKTLGPDWTINRLSEVDTSPQSHLQLSTAARNYQNAISRRARHRRKYKKVSDSCHNRQSDLQERLRRENISSLDQAIRDAEARLGDLENLAQLRVREAEYDQRIRSANAQLEKNDLGTELPWWAQTMLTLFAMAGGFFIIAGLVNGVKTGWVIGLIYLLTGIMGGGLAFALRRHYESDSYSLNRRLRDEIEKCQAQLNDVRARIARITGEKLTRAPREREVNVNRSWRSESELIRKATQRLVDLQGLARTQERILKTRKKLSVQRGKLAEYQRNVSATRQAWCDLLRTLGIRETVRTSEAFLSWQHAVDAQQTLRQWQGARDDVQRHQELLNQFRDQMEMIASRMSMRSNSSERLTETLNTWQHLLEDYENNHGSYLKKRSEYRELRKRVAAAKTESRRCNEKLQRLLNDARVSTPDEYRALAEKKSRAEKLQALITDLNDQLASISREEPELAIVEEDLVDFNVDSNQERIDMLGLEIDDLDAEYSAAQEELGRLRQTLETLESDTSSDDLKAKQARVLDRAAASWRDLEANRIAASALSRMTSEFEQKFQPETLARASDYLAQLTCGRYGHVRTPVGTRELLIREQDGTTRNVGELSDGTREQLFLSIRMALIDTFAEEGIEMPIVFDDICVNFDQQRTEAAAETLMNFASNKQVLFFTCHQHLAGMFEEREVEPIWLPALAQANARLAG